jgi:hypothetical protein
MAIDNPLSPILEASEPETEPSDDEGQPPVALTRPTTPQFPQLASLQRALQAILPIQGPGHLYASQFAAPASNYSAVYYGLNQSGSISSNPRPSSVSQVSISFLYIAILLRSQLSSLLCLITFASLSSFPPSPTHHISRLEGSSKSL